MKQLVVLSDSRLHCRTLCAMQFKPYAPVACVRNLGLNACARGQFVLVAWHRSGIYTRGSNF